MMSDQAIAFLALTEFGEIYQCLFCLRKHEVPHGADLPVCACSMSQIMQDEFTGAIPE